MGVFGDVFEAAMASLMSSENMIDQHRALFSQDENDAADDPYDERENEIGYQ
jgi:hypothetical protein